MVTIRLSAYPILALHQVLGPLGSRISSYIPAVSRKCLCILRCSFSWRNYAVTPLIAHPRRDSNYRSSRWQLQKNEFPEAYRVRNDDPLQRKRTVPMEVLSMGWSRTASMSTLALPNVPPMVPEQAQPTLSQQCALPTRHSASPLTIGSRWSRTRTT